MSAEPRGQCLLWHHNPHRSVMSSSVVPAIRIVGECPPVTSLCKEVKVSPWGGGTLSFVLRGTIAVYLCGS